MTFVPRIGSSSEARSRARKSVALPGACGTIKRIGFCGNEDCAARASGRSITRHRNRDAKEATKARARDLKVVVCMGVSCIGWVQLCRSGLGQGPQREYGISACLEKG